MKCFRVILAAVLAASVTFTLQAFGIKVPIPAAIGVGVIGGLLVSVANSFDR